jgi:hypothetical protein
MSARFLKVAVSLAALVALGALLSCDFFVDANAIASIAITPNNPTSALNNSGGTKNTQQFTATATLGNQTQQDVTGQSTWTSSNTGAATISNTGLATAVNLGSTTITATDGSNKAQTTLTIATVAVKSVAIGCGAGTLNCSNSGATISRSTSVQLTATATFSDNTQQDVTNSATWASSNSNVASVSSTGLVTAGSTNTGTVNITATFQGTASPNFPVTVQ